MAKDANNNKKGFYKYIGQKRKARESIHPLINEKLELVMTSMEKADVLNFLPQSSLPARLLRSLISQKL